MTYLAAAKPTRAFDVDVDPDAAVVLKSYTEYHDLRNSSERIILSTERTFHLQGELPLTIPIVPPVTLLVKSIPMIPATH